MIAAGNPWHGSIDSSGLHLPNGSVVPCAVPARAGHTWLTAFAGLPAPPPPSDSLLAAGGEWRTDVVWHTVEKRYSPLAESGIGYMAWLWRSSAGVVYRLQLAISWDDDEYAAGAVADVVLTVTATRFGRFALGADPEPVLQLLSQPYSLATRGTGPCPVAPLLDHTADGSRTAVTLRLGPNPVPDNLTAGNLYQSEQLGLAWMPLALVELIVTEADGVPAVTAQLVVDSQNTYIESETSTPAAAPHTLLQVTTDQDGRCLPAGNGTDYHRIVSQLVAGCYTAAGALVQVWQDYEYWSAQVGAGRIALGDEVLTAVDPAYEPNVVILTAACTDVDGQTPGPQLNIASYSAPAIDITVTNGQTEIAEYRLRIGAAVVETRRFEGAGSSSWAVTAPAVDWQPGPICRIWPSGDWSEEVPLQQVSIGSPSGSATLLLDGQQIGAESAANAGSMTIIGAINGTDPVRGAWYKFRPAAIGPRLFAQLAADYAGGSPAAPRLWGQAVHSSHGTSAQLPAPLNVGVYAALVASVDPRTDQISIAPAARGTACYC
jgi:hypothetical protein